MENFSVVEMKLRIAIIGATGIVGQQAMLVLANSPDFEVIALAASQRSSGKKYASAITENSVLQWHAGGNLPEKFAEMPVHAIEELNPRDFDVVFSCLESEAARAFEPRFAQHCGVVSTASAFRYEEDVPLIIPQVNPEHASLIERQRKNRNWKGFICPIPNCTVTGLAITLKPLDDAFGVKKVGVVSMQAVSGAGRSPGVRALDITDNIVPFIAGEEEKVEREAQKILGREIIVSATCTRVPVLEGHFEAVNVELEKRPTVEQVKKVFSDFAAPIKTRSTPEQIIKVFEDESRPQPRLDRDAGNGLTTCVGRVRLDPLLGLKYVLLSHNTKMGAAAGAVWLAEVLAKQGYIE